MKYKAILWDLDGTLLYTLTDLRDAVVHALTVYGLPPRSLTEVRAMVGNGIRNLIERAVPAGTDPAVTDAVFEEFRAYYGVHCRDTTAPYEGIPELLAELSRAGILSAIVSNKADFATRDLAEYHFGNLVSLAVGAREDMPKKPAPDMIFYALRELGVSPAEAVYIGDSEVDVETAAGAGLYGIAVNWGFRDEAELRKAGARVIVSSPEELRGILMG